jgi:23S rRNA pseudouridine1911/1915/1917 synthase
LSSEITVTSDLDGARLDKALVTLLPNASRAKVKRAIEEGLVRVNGRRAAKGTSVAAGDSLRVESDDLESTGACVPTPDAPLDVRFETSKLLVVYKPAKMPTAPIRAGETGTLANALVGHYPELAGVGYGEREPGLLHRLDNDTSGLLVVAKNTEAFGTLRAAMEAGTVDKHYLLIVSSEDMLETGTISYPLANHPKDQKRVLACIHPRDVMRNAPRPATTEYSVVKTNGTRALVRASAGMALRHQIRAHFAAIDHPLWGDVLYGGIGAPGLERHALHAERLRHQDADPELTFDVTAELPADMQAVLDA